MFKSEGKLANAESTDFNQKLIFCGEYRYKRLTPNKKFKKTINEAKYLKEKRKRIFKILV